MTSAKRQKVVLFLDQFTSEDEFLAWCEGQGVTGIPGDSVKCLVAEAIHRATGVRVRVLEGTGLWVDYYQPINASLLPACLAAVPINFDRGKYPSLVKPQAS